MSNANNQIVNNFLNFILLWSKELQKGLNNIALRVKEFWESDNIHISLKLIPIVLITALMTLMIRGFIVNESYVSRVDYKSEKDILVQPVTKSTDNEDLIKKHQQELQSLRDDLNIKHQQELQLAREDLKKKHEDSLKILKHQQLLEIMQTKLAARAKSKIQRTVAAIPVVGLASFAYFEKIEFDEWKKDHSTGTVEEYSKEIYEKTQELLDSEYSGIKKYADNIYNAYETTDFSGQYDELKKNAGEFTEQTKEVVGEYFDKIFK